MNYTPSKDEMASYTSEDADDDLDEADDAKADAAMDDEEGHRPTGGAGR